MVWLPANSVMAINILWYGYIDNTSMALSHRTSKTLLFKSMHLFIYIILQINFFVSTFL